MRMDGSNAGVSVYMRRQDSRSDGCVLEENNTIYEAGVPLSASLNVWFMSLLPETQMM